MSQPAFQPQQFQPAPGGLTALQQRLQGLGAAPAAAAPQAGPVGAPPPPWQPPPPVGYGGVASEAAAPSAALPMNAAPQPQAAPPPPPPPPPQQQPQPQPQAAPQPQQQQQIAQVHTDPTTGQLYMLVNNARIAVGYGGGSGQLAAGSVAVGYGGGSGQLAAGSVAVQTPVGNGQPAQLQRPKGYPRKRGEGPEAERKFQEKLAKWRAANPGVAEPADGGAAEVDDAREDDELYTKAHLIDMVRELKEVGKRLGFDVDVRL